MKKQSINQNRPYLCPGCNAPLDTDHRTALAHMADCPPLHHMIILGRYSNAIRIKAAKDMHAIAK